MERAADVEANRALGSGFFRQCHRALDAGFLAADDELSGTVVVRRDNEPRLHGRLRADLFDRPTRFTQERGHRARTFDTALVHELTAAPNDAHRILEAQ